MKYFFLCTVIGLLLLAAEKSSAQFTRQDTLRGTITPARAWWDVTRYDIVVTPDYNTRTIKGECTIGFDVKSALPASRLMQLDLQVPMNIDSILYHNRMLSYRRDSNAWFVTWPAGFPAKNDKITIYFSGKPREAVNPPWDGGWIWKKDNKGRPWMSVACQGLGASVWYPCKDHQSDEPNKGASLTMIVPDTLVAVGNGRLIKTSDPVNGLTSWTWEVKNPINNYNIIPYIGKYVTWHDEFNGEKGKLDLDYWVLDYDLEKARSQFGRDVKPMMACFEKWFGPYPFYEDGYKLVESPHLGMEHQSAVAYGNKFLNGYLGSDLSASGWGLKWDYIIIHESGHEWFANNITTNDIADMWVHEGFTNYSEPLFVECQFGKKAADEYCQGLRRNIRNDAPIIGKYGVNKEGSGDMYAKGSNLIHTIRQVINDDVKFMAILRGLNKKFYHSTVTSKQVETYFTQQSGKDLSKIFDQYLRAVSIPVLEYRVEGNELTYRWAKCNKGFDMPLELKNTKGSYWLRPSTQWKKIVLPEGFSMSDVNRNFYIFTSKVP